MQKINNLSVSSSSVATATFDLANSRRNSLSTRLISVHNQPTNFHSGESPEPSVAEQERASVYQAYLPEQFPYYSDREKKIMVNEIIRENTLDDTEKEQKLRNRVNNLNFAELFNVAKGKDFRKFTNIIGLSTWDKVRTSSTLGQLNNFCMFSSGVFWIASATLPAKDYPGASGNTNLAAGCLAVVSGLLSLSMGSFAKKINDREEREKNRCQLLAELRLYCINNQIADGKLPSVKDSEESQLWQSVPENIHASSRLLFEQV